MDLPLTMKALRKPYGKEGLILEKNAPMPKEIGPEDVLIKVLRASVCGTDLHIYKSDPSIRDRVANNQIIGHEFCGVVMDVGDQVTILTKGDIVSSESHIVCGSCYQCTNGQPHLCQEISLIGVDRPGGLAQYVVIPAKNAIKTSNISLEVASFMDAYGNAVDTAMTIPLSAKTVLITGCGPQGLMAIAIAAALGAKQIIATEVSEKRIGMAWDILGQHLQDDVKHSKSIRRKDDILNPLDRNLVSKIYELTGGLGVDVLLEMSGHPSAISDGLTVLRSGGNAVILGLASDKIELDWNDLVFKGVTIYFRYGRKLYETWTNGQMLLKSGLINLESLIHKPYFTLDEFEIAFDKLLNGEAAKVIFLPNPDS